MTITDPTLVAECNWYWEDSIEAWLLPKCRHTLAVESVGFLPASFDIIPQEIAVTTSLEIYEDIFPI